MKHYRLDGLKKLTNSNILKIIKSLKVKNKNSLKIIKEIYIINRNYYTI